MVHAGTHGGPGVAGHLANASTDPMLGHWRVVGPAVGAFFAVLADQCGYFDELNAGGNASVGQAIARGNHTVAHAARHPLHTMRSMLTQH